MDIKGIDRARTIAARALRRIGRLPRRALSQVVRRAVLGLALASLPPASVFAASPGETMAIEVDASNTAQKLLEVHERIAVAPGPLRLVLPRWLPGWHGPFGDVNRLLGPVIDGDGKRIPWQRDAIDPTAFAIVVPPGVSAIDLRYKVVQPADGTVFQTAWNNDMLDFEWTPLLLYPAGPAVADIAVSASVKLPKGWKFGTALRARGEHDGWVDFQDESLETLADSPIFAGRHYRRVELDAAGEPRPVVMHLFADSEARLAASDAQIEAHRRMLREAVALFGVRPWRHYDLLLAFGDGVPFNALEHRESSENTTAGAYFEDWSKGYSSRSTVAHEFVHAWNGKYYRPADLWAADFHTPTRNSLLWVYEGLTSYWEYVIATRAGLVTPELTRYAFGFLSAAYAAHAGRTWRSLQDTVNLPQTGMFPSFSSDLGRDQDYYEESAIAIWLDADTLIREGSGGARSLDDFMRAFYKGFDGDLETHRYRFADVVEALNAVYPYDWATFLRKRLDRVGDAPIVMDGIARSGWKVAFADKRDPLAGAFGSRDKPTHAFAYSLGLTASDKDGKVVYLLWDSPAQRAGIGPDDTIIAVNRRAYTYEGLDTAIAANKDGSHPIELLLKRGDEYRLTSLDVRMGMRHPGLERVEGTPDLLGAILAPVAK